MTRSKKRKLTRVGRYLVGLPLASVACGGSLVAYAQQVEPATLEEIVVTAQKRSEDLQKVPISLQVLGGEKLEQLQVASFDDYAKFLPSVSFQSLGPSQAQLYFRGITSGSDGLHAGSLPATGVYLDELPVTTIGGNLDVHVYDIARVEALAGPQGTLYGASSLSGTMRIITNKPDPKGFSAGYDLKADKFGKGNPGGEIEGFVNMPVSDHAAVRLVGFYEHDGGYINNVLGSNHYERPDATLVTAPIDVSNAPVVKNRFNDVDTYGGRAALKVDLNDQWSVSPTILFQDQKANGNFSFDPKKGDLNVVDFRVGSNHDQWYQAALAIEGKIGNFDFVYSGGWLDRQVDNLVDYSQYTVAYDALSFLPDHQYAYTRFTDDAGNIIDPTQYTANHDTYTKMNNEVRISSPTDWPFRFVTGAFYQRQTDNIRAEFRVDNLPAFWEVTGQPDTLYLSQQDRTDRDYAVFADTTFDFSEKLKGSLGVRQFWVNNTLFGFFGYNGNLSSAGEAACLEKYGGYVAGSDRPCVNTDKKEVESGETHRVNLTYQINADHMVYGTYSTGFRPGGNNRRVQALTFRADKLTNFELGWKTSWLDRRLRFNGAAFYEKWKNAQVAIQGQSGITSIVNAGDAKVVGVESDVSWLVAERLNLSASVSKLFQSETTTDFCAPTPVGAAVASCAPADLAAPKGTHLPVTPTLKANATARYKFNVANFDSFVQASVLYQSSTTYSLQVGATGPTVPQSPNQLVGDSPSFTTVDFSIGTNAGKWSVEAYVENAFDRRGELGRTSECGDLLGICYSNPRVYPIKPMNFGIKFGQKF